MMKNIDNYCVLYCRVSSKPQEEQGLSLDAQESLLRDWAKDNNFLPVKLYRVQESATKSIRKGLRNMLQFCDENEIKNVFVEKVDRLNRDNPEIEALIEKYRKEHGFKFYLIKDNEILDENLGATQKLVYDFKRIVAGWQAGNIAEESAKGTKEALKRGEFPSIPPLGYRSIPKTKRTPHKIAQTEKASKVRELLELFSTGKYSLAQAIKLARDIGLTPKVKETFTRGAMAKLLKNRFYYGEFEYAHSGIEGGKAIVYQNKTVEFEPLISKETWKKIQEALKKRQNNFNGVKKLKFRFNNLMTCGKCGHAIFGVQFSHNVSWDTKNGKQEKQYTYEPAYRCTYGTWYTPDGKKIVPKEYVDKDTLTVKEDITYWEDEHDKRVQKIWLKKGTELEARKCDHPSFSEKEIEDILMSKVSMIKFNQKHWQEVKDALFQDENKEFLDYEIRNLRSEMTKNETKLDEFYSDYKKGIIDEEYCSSRSKEVRERQQEIKERLEELEEERELYDERIGKAIATLDGIKNWDEVIEKADKNKKDQILRLLTTKIFTSYAKVKVRGAEREYKDLQIVWNNEVRELYELGILELAEKYEAEIERFLIGDESLYVKKLGMD